jgi:hypothetical protein
MSVHWFRGSWPAGTFVQAPALPATAHERHSPVQAVPQHTPCWQKPEAHSEPAVQVAAGGLRPQLELVQTLPAVQSALVPQVTRQAPVVSQTYGEQGCDIPGVQCACPSQRPPCVRVEPMQVCMLHAVPEA